MNSTNTNTNYYLFYLISLTYYPFSRNVQKSCPSSRIANAWLPASLSDTVKVFDMVFFNPTLLARCRCFRSQPLPWMIDRGKLALVSAVSEIVACGETCMRDISHLGMRCVT